MQMIVGLGNPGKEYEKTKHNVGFWAIDKLADEMGILVEKKQCNALIQQGILEGKKVLLVKPQTYMNLSGEAVIQLLHFYKNQIDDILVIHDDLDLEPGVLRFKKGGGGSGGHNGIKSIATHLHSNDFDRLKIGIGRGNKETKDYVLSPFLGETLSAVNTAVALTVNAVKCWVKEGIDPAMNQYNSKKKD